MPFPAFANNSCLRILNKMIFKVYVSKECLNHPSLIPPNEFP